MPQNQINLAGGASPSPRNEPIALELYEPVYLPFGKLAAFFS
jgi:hypothetical protein